MRRPVLLLLILVAASCSRTELTPPPTASPATAAAPPAGEMPKADPSPAPAEPVAGELALAAAGTKLFADPGLKAHVLTVDAYPELGVPLRIRSIDGDVAAVESLAKGPCSPTVEPLTWAELKLYVRTSDLATVVREEFQVNYSDGTEVIVHPGAVAAAGGVRVLLRSDIAVMLPVTIPPEKLGASHPAREEQPPKQYQRLLARTVTVKLDGRFLKLDTVVGLTEITDKGQESFVRVAGQCAAATLRIATADLNREAREDALGSLFGNWKTEATVDAGTALVWEDGTTAGQAVKRGLLPVPQSPRATRTCWQPEAFAVDAKLCAPSDKVVAAVDEGTIGLGGLGLVGTGRGGGGSGGAGGGGSGYGRGSGAGFGGRGKRVPRVRQAKAKVVGPLDKDIIRRIVRAHINEVRYCYNQGLVKDPNLKGRVEVKFTIGADGKVDKSAVKKQTVSKLVAGCIAKAVKKWKFPRPQGGAKVKVTYSFVLEPG